MRHVSLLRRQLAILAVVAVAVAVAMATTASVAAAKPAEQSEKPTAQAAFGFWIASKTYCLGKRDTRKLISVLNNANDTATVSVYLAEAFPGFVAKIVGAAIKYQFRFFDDWSRDTARAYLHSGRRGAKVRIGLRAQLGNPNGLWLDAKKRGRSC